MLHLPDNEEFAIALAIGFGDPIGRNPPHAQEADRIVWV